jgi:hypothetical protein
MPPTWKKFPSPVPTGFKKIFFEWGDNENFQKLKIDFFTKFIFLIFYKNPKIAFCVSFANTILGRLLYHSFGRGTYYVSCLSMANNSMIQIPAQDILTLDRCDGPFLLV